MSTSERQEIYPLGAGQFTVAVTIAQIVGDPAGVLDNITSVDVCYDTKMNLVSGRLVEVKGTYYDGACPLPYCGRVKASSISTITALEEPPEPGEQQDLYSPNVLTGSAEATETTVTLQGILTDDGGDSCKARFSYKRYEDPSWWHTDWVENLSRGSTITQEIAGLIPGTRYFYYAEAVNSVGQGTGRQGSFVTLQETVPPIPHPAVWLAAPDQVDTTSLTMTADVERDISGPVEYFFDFVASPTGGAGGTDSFWQLSPIYVDVGLNPNQQYGYRLKARDGHGNETAYSPVEYAYTGIETPAGVAFGDLTSSSIQVKSSSALSGLNRGKSGLLLENVTTGGVSAWQQQNALWTSDKLLPNTSYTFRARARNGDGDLTPLSPEVHVCTLANVPVPGTFTAIAATSIQVQWGANGNPSGTLYFCENTTSGTNSGWTPCTTWTDIGLTPNTSYSYRVKTRNTDGVETAWTTLGTQSTDYRSLTISSTSGGKVSTPAPSVFRCAPGATVNLVAVPLPGYHFLCWSGSAVDAGRVADPQAAQTTVLVDGQYTLVANFLRTQIFVDKRATGAKDGSSWTNAYTSLQDALDTARPGHEIWVAQGTYKPDAGKNVLTGDPTATFMLQSGVALKGGYAGLGKSDPNARDITAYETVLSGDLKGDDKPAAQSFDLYSEASRTDNSLHVVSALNVDNKALLEGVTITGGNGIDGAGLCLVRSNLVISQCILHTNRAGELSGDGLEGWGEGAGASCYQSEPTFRGCVFLSNWAGAQGGGLYSIESSPTLTDCVFQDNEAGLQGGALYGEDGNQVCLGCTFHGNWAQDGGAFYSDEGSDTRVTNCRFLGNAGHGSGGAVFATGRSLTMTNSLFSANLAFADGGAVVLAQGSGVWTNCTFNRNIAQGKQTGQALTVRQTTATLTNCILWDHVDSTHAQIALTGAAGNPAVVVVSYSDVLGGAGAVIRNGTATVTWGAGNLNADPRFQNPDGPDHVGGTLDDDLHLKPGSPGIDAGDDRAVPTDLDDLDADGNRSERILFDLDGHPRFVDDPATPNTGVADAPLYPQIVDLGAYEFQKP